MLCDLHYPDFARSKLSYRGRMSRKLCKTLSFPLQKKIRSSHLCSSSLTLDYNPSSGPQFLRFEPTGSPLCWLRIKATFLFPPNLYFSFSLGGQRKPRFGPDTLCFSAALFTQRILFIHNGLPQVTLPLCLDVKPHCLCSGPCPPVDHYRKEEIDTSPPRGFPDGTKW